MKIEGSKIIAEEGFKLIRKSDLTIIGSSVTLGTIYYLGGKRLEVPIEEKPEDYMEVLNPIVLGREVISVEDTNSIVSQIVKLKYTLEEQMAILLNYTSHPENPEYLREFREMEEWRELAKRKAKEFMK